MAGLVAQRRSMRLAASVAAALVVGLVSSSTSHALEAFDGRIQVHGFAEMQIRALDEKFEQQLDLAQWYNVVNVELELGILPDGWGPIDLLTAYVRVEGRYDCVYTEGCGMFPSVDAYGDQANRLPDRLADAEGEDYSGVIETGPRTPTDPDNLVLTMNGQRLSGVDLSTIEPVGTIFVANLPTVPFIRDPNGEVIENRGFLPGLLEQRGADDIPNTADDPFRYTMERYLDYALAFQNVRNFDGGRTRVLGPWLPKNFVESIGTLRNKANPFRGRMTPSPGGGVDGFLRYHSADQVINRNRLGFNTRPAVAPSDVPDVAIDVIAEDGSIVTRFVNDNPFRGLPTSIDVAAVTGPLDSATYNELLVQSQNRIDQFPEELLEYLPPNILGQPFSGLVRPNGALGNFVLPIPRSNFTPAQGGRTLTNTAILTDNENIIDVNFGATDPFGGDYSGIVPCVNSDLSGLQYGEQVRREDDGQLQFPGCLPRRNIRVVGGTAELPFRPAPDLSNLDVPGSEWDPTVAQGLYIPSAGLIQYLNEGDFDSLDMNFRESERAWNHGSSQQDWKELKEAYVDIEVLDSRLWMRLGLQQIVWGKTELFRLTDQFNPVDLALASLPSLEESRIALIAGRFVYSFYKLGPIEDVRFEFAFNFDQVEPSDLGACGEPYAIDLVCALSFGAMSHGFLGLGIAGVNRPASPWEDLGGIELGGRIEWRWDRFSFALTDFYGYDDLPTIESIMTFERNVDVDTGRPLVTRYNPGNERGTCSGSALDLADPNGVKPSRRPESVTVAAIGTDLDCLKFGAPFANDPQNALQFHHANQQLFAWVCSVSVGVASALDAGACQATLFGSPKLLNAALQVPFSELVTTLSAGEFQANNYFGTIASALSSSGTLQVSTPTQSLNRDANDGIIGALSGSNMRCLNPITGEFDRVRNQACGGGAELNGGINQTATDANGAPIGNLVTKLLPSRADFLTLDSGLTNEQRAMLGCGPFWGTRCDSSASMINFDCEGVVGCQNQNNSIVPVPIFNTVIQTDGFEFRDKLWSQIFPASVGNGGGIDLLNLEASAMVQSWGGVEGTTQNYIATSLADAPGTVNFSGGPVCTRYVPGEATPRKLPGCRGIDSYVLPDDPDDGSPIFFTFEEGYDPTVDGCLLAPMIGNHEVRTLDSDGNDFTGSSEMMSCFGQLAPTSGDFFPGEPGPQPITNFNPCADFLVPTQPFGTDLNRCKRDIARFLDKTNSDSRRGNYGIKPRIRTVIQLGADPHIANIRGASTLYHPLAGCLTPREMATLSTVFGEPSCNAKPLFPQNGLSAADFIEVNSEFRSFTDQQRANFGHGSFPRDFDAEFLVGRAQIFQNELAVVSWNFGMFMVVASGCAEREETVSNPECFDSKRPYSLDRCSFNKMYMCSAIKGILGIAGVQRNVVKAGGNGQYGRRTLLWHGGQEVVLNYDKRNVFGFSTDFSEDNTKTNWGLEFTWFESVKLGNNNEFDNTKSVDTLNLTVTVDRPTFINFLNANRTFFFNSQWFFRYVKGHSHGSTGDEWDVLFTFAMFTGYYQDRLNPSLVAIYDFNSQSGGVLPSISYRFTQSFSASLGVSLFFGRTELNDMGVNPLGPPANRAGADAYKNGGGRFLSNLRKRDEAWLRLRWTF